MIHSFCPILQTPHAPNLQLLFFLSYLSSIQQFQFLIQISVNVIILVIKGTEQLFSFFYFFNLNNLAERVGFEPTVPLRVLQISSLTQ